MYKFLTGAIVLLLPAYVIGNPLIFDNIGPNGGIHYAGVSPTSQLDNGFGFDAGAADDFTLGSSPHASGDWYITGVSWSGLFALGSPAPISGFNIIFWPEDISDAKPAGGTPPGNSPDYSAALARYENIPFSAIGGAGGPNTFDYHADLAVPFLADDNVPYWIEIQPEVNFPPLWGWQVTSGNTQGAIPHVGFSGLLDTVEFWTEADAPLDLAFQLQGIPFPEPGSALLLLPALYLMRRKAAGPLVFRVL